MAELEIRNLSFAYEDADVLRDVNLVLHDREIVCILGASGGGKTTIFNLIAGLLYKYTRKLPAAYAGEIFGTGIVGGMLSYPIARLVMGNGQAALFTFVVPFLISTVAGTILGAVITMSLHRTGYLSRVQDEL